MGFLPNTGRGGAEVGATRQQVNRTLLPVTSNSLISFLFARFIVTRYTTSF
jgi:hypothetical protein